MLSPLNYHLFREQIGQFVALGRQRYIQNSHVKLFDKQKSLSFGKTNQSSEVVALPAASWTFLMERSPVFWLQQPVMVQVLVPTLYQISSSDLPLVAVGFLICTTFPPFRKEKFSPIFLASSSFSAALPATAAPGTCFFLFMKEMEQASWSSSSPKVQVQPLSTNLILTWPVRSRVKLSTAESAETCPLSTRNLRASSWVFSRVAPDWMKNPATRPRTMVANFIIDTLQLKIIASCNYQHDIKVLLAVKQLDNPASFHYL